MLENIAGMNGKCWMPLGRLETRLLLKTQFEFHFFDVQKHWQNVGHDRQGKCAQKSHTGGGVFRWAVCTPSAVQIETDCTSTVGCCCFAVASASWFKGNRQFSATLLMNAELFGIFSSGIRTASY